MKNMSRLLERFPRRVNLFWIALPGAVAIAVTGILWPESFAGTVSELTSRVFGAIDWFFMISVTGFLILSIWLAFGRFRSVKLGGPDDEPEFSTGSWLAMLFAAGMGVGLLFWGVAEPMIHFSNPPEGEPGSVVAARRAMVITLLHWGFHAWAIYAVGALVLAYFHYRKGAPYLAGTPIRLAFAGSGRWVEPLASLADLIAVLSVALGVAGSLAMGVFQLQTGLSVVLGTPGQSPWFAILLLLILFVAFMLSAATGLDKGIKILSNLNMLLAIGLLAFLLLAGPTPFLLRCFTTGLGDYVSSIVGISLQLYPYQDLRGWMGSWTLTYFIWWIAWAPFVGIFIARISKGRTIREFVIGVLLAPTIFSMLWFSVFGGLGIFEETQGAGGIADLVDEDIALALFSLLGRMPLSSLLTIIALVLLFVFIVTSADSATFVLGMLTSQGTMNPPTRRKLAWGVALAGLGAALVLSDNIHVVRAGAITFALPLTLILLLQAAALIRVLLLDERSRPAEVENVKATEEAAG